MPDTQHLHQIVIATLDDAKAVDIRHIDVRKLTDITDEMIICHGTSDRHVQALARRLTDTLAEQGIKAAGIEGDEQGEWILIDLIDILVHIMKREARDHYDLESLWDHRLARTDQSAQNA